jgi:beta-lactam-binding protein with PASTA domain
MNTSRLRIAVILPIAFALASCAPAAEKGGTSAYVPKVVGERLDVAKSDLEHAGLSEDDIEVVGGGTFGVIDESNWTVCEQRPGPGQAMTESARVIVDRVCTAESDASASPTTAPVQTTVPVTAVPVEASSTASGGVMPDVYCMNLQDAQDEIQRNGVFFSRSHDATGQDRMQLVDSNWIVVGQSPAPGAHNSEFEAVLEVVKYGEPNPC